MRCSTPKILVSDKGLRCPFSKKGNQYIRNPRRNMMAARFNTFFKKMPLPTDSYFFMLKLMAFPTTKRKVGKTRSVRVNPCHWACIKGE
jgi:hypothetical protein